MRCTNCGFPVSPSRTRCARCGTAVERGAESRTSQQQDAQENSVPERGGVPVGLETHQDPWQISAPATPWNAASSNSYKRAASNPSASALSPLQASSFSPLDSALSERASAKQWAATDVASPISSSRGRDEFALAPQRPGQRGFTLAGALICTGGLLLVIVYVLASMLPPTIASGQNTLVQTPVVQEPTQAPKEPTPKSERKKTPTVSTAMNGKQYIDNAHTTSAVNVDTAQPLNFTSQFRVQQQINVTFSLHTHNTPGWACLNWYLNDRQFSHYSLRVYGYESSAYSYAYAGSPGSGYVQIAWAGDESCTDALLAEQVSFTVVA